MYIYPFKEPDPEQLLWQTVKTHNAAFHQDLHCLLRQNRSTEEAKQYVLEIKTFAPSIYTMDHYDLTVFNFMGNSICTERLNFSQYTGELKQQEYIF